MTQQQVKEAFAQTWVHNQRMYEELPEKQKHAAQEVYYFVRWSQIQAKVAAKTGNRPSRSAVHAHLVRLCDAGFCNRVWRGHDGSFYCPAGHFAKMAERYGKAA